MKLRGPQPPPLTKGTHMWPSEFPITMFSYDTELQLEKGNTAYRSKMTRLTLSSKTVRYPEKVS